MLSEYIREFWSLEGQAAQYGYGHVMVSSLFGGAGWEQISGSPWVSLPHEV